LVTFALARCLKDARTPTVARSADNALWCDFAHSFAAAPTQLDVTYTTRCEKSRDGWSRKCDFLSDFGWRQSTTLTTPSDAVTQRQETVPLPPTHPEDFFIPERMFARNSPYRGGLRRQPLGHNADRHSPLSQISGPANLNRPVKVALTPPTSIHVRPPLRNYPSRSSGAISRRNDPLSNRLDLPVAGNLSFRHAKEPF